MQECHKVKAFIVGEPAANTVEFTDTIVVIRQSELKNFIVALNRAVSTWQDPPPEILLLKQKLCGDPVVPKVPSWPNPADHNTLTVLKTSVTQS